MNTTHLIRTTIILASILLMHACRSSKHLSSTNTSTTTITAQKIDSAAQTLRTSTRHKTTITFLPMPQPGWSAPSTPSTPEAPSNLIDQLIAQGGGTIIIEQEEQLEQDQSTTISQTSVQDTTNTQNTNHNEIYTQPPRASPILDKILYILIAAAILVLIVRCHIRQ